MMIADSASAGIGFPFPSTATPTPTPDDAAQKALWKFVDFYVREYKRWLAEEEENEGLRYLPNSLCMMVPPGEVCVQPKTITAQAGCTLRSLSHHLALLPSVGEVKTSWRFAERTTPRQVLNLLAVPFPYRLHSSCFVQGGSCPCTGGHSLPLILRAARRGGRTRPPVLRRPKSSWLRHRSRGREAQD